MDGVNLSWPLEDPFKGSGRLLHNGYDRRSWVLLDDDGNYLGQCIQVYHGPMIDQNKEDLNASLGKRWGNGRRVASIPLPIWWRTIKPARENGDEKWIRKFLNDPDNRDFRTFQGKL